MSLLICSVFYLLFISVDCNSPPRPADSGGKLQFVSSSTTSTSSASSRSSTKSSGRCNGDYGVRNATYKRCPNPCPGTCENPKGVPFCYALCEPYGWECNPGYVLNKGKCILVKDCPAKPKGCNGDINASYSKCPSACQATCDDPGPFDFCTQQCLPEGCVCNKGYVKDSNGKCILPENCPVKPKGCNGDRNATFSSCPFACQQSCDHPEPYEACTLQCLPAGCVCNKGYIKDSNGKCILPKDCPAKPKGCNGDVNAYFSNCPSACQQSCDHPEPYTSCTRQCLPEGCVCNKGYVKDSNGKCILPQNCPVKPVGCKGDRNATLSGCPSACQQSCDHPEPYEACTLQCLPEGCVCNKGYIKDSNGKCILPKDCPAKPKGCNGDVNAYFSNCPSACQQSCDHPEPYTSCTRQCLPEGCVCNKGYVKDSNGKCILPQNCPVKPVGCKGDRNATLSGCPSACQQSCDHPEPYEACTLQCLPEGCVCNKGYIKDSNGKCILPKDCPAKPKGCNGDVNAYFSNCPSACQQSCDHPEPYTSCTRQCLPEGCVCNKGYVKDSNGKCILPQNCPVKPVGCKGDRNATLSGCPSACQQSCDHPEPYEACTLQCLPEGCVCNKGYVKDSNGKCILPKDCPAKPKGCNGDINASFSKCPSACQGTCDNPGPFDFCTEQCLPEGCVCNKGYVKDSNGKCILPENCPVKPKGCKGDRNATLSGCPSACQQSCDHPEPYEACTLQCLPEGCVCNKGYVKDSNGKCILPKDCPAKPKGCNGDINASYSKCPSACQGTCDNPGPFDFCTQQCLPEGCVCNKGYVKDSNGKCILPENCPVKPKGCNGDRNATLSNCPSACQQSCDHPEPYTSCTRQCLPEGCVCNKGYVKDNNGKCILPKDCPVKNVGCNGDRNATLKDCPSICQRTCKHPGPYEVCADVCLPKGCVCNDGYVKDDNGLCILPQDCPGICSPNATFKKCPNPCPGTCDIPGGTGLVCKKKCEEYGCECNQGFYLNDQGQCVKLEDCPGAKKCSANETFAFCNAGCPNNFCPTDDSRGIIACSPPVPCHSGCSCKSGYLRRKEDNKCVLSKDCPPIKCTRQNEVYSASPPQCLFERCSDIGKKNICDKKNSVTRPQCICKPGFYRNDKDLCVPKDQCYPTICGENEILSDCKIECPPQTCESIFTTYACNKTECKVGCDCIDGYLRNGAGCCIPSELCFVEPECEITPECRATCSNPNPSNCPVLEPSPDNKDGCRCKPGYILSDANGVCIKIEECPDLGCNGDPNAIITKCPWTKPSTCDSPNASSSGPCDPVGCQCKPGFILSGINGKCILPEECKNGNPCGPNGIFSDCAFPCPNQYCPADDSLVQTACKPGRPCPSGCLCKLNYRFKSFDDRTCIVSSDCPPVNCTRPNEVWDPCPSACLSEYCDAVDDQPTVCNTLVLNCNPRCVCKKTFFRNSSDICVSSQECRELNKKGQKIIYN